MQVGMIQPLDKRKINFGSGDSDGGGNPAAPAEVVAQAMDKANGAMAAANDGLQETARNVGLLGTTTVGLIATLKKPFIALDNWMKVYKMEPVLDENGERVIKDGVEQFKKVFVRDKETGNILYNRAKKLGVLGGAAAVIGALVIAAIVKKAKANKAKKEAELAEQKKLEAEKAKAELAKAEALKAEVEAAKLKEEKAKAEKTEAKAEVEEVEEAPDKEEE